MCGRRSVAMMENSFLIMGHPGRMPMNYDWE